MTTQRRPDAGARSDRETSRLDRRTRLPFLSLDQRIRLKGIFDELDRDGTPKAQKPRGDEDSEKTLNRRPEREYRYPGQVF